MFLYYFVLTDDFLLSLISATVSSPENIERFRTRGNSANESPDLGQVATRTIDPDARKQ